MPIESNRNLGRIGSYLSVLGVVSTILSIIQYLVFGFDSRTNLAILGILGIGSIFGFLSFIGFILFLVAMYGLSRDYGEHRIFNFILYGILGAIVTGVIVAAVWFALTITSIIANLPSFGMSPSQSDIQSILNPYLGSVLPIAAIAGLVWIWFNVKALNLLANKSAVPQFRTAAKLLLVGAIVNIALSVVFGVLVISGAVDYRSALFAGLPGGIVQYVAWAVNAKAFSAIKAPATQPYTPASVPPVSGQLKYCPNCGTANQLDSAYCIRCGQKL